MDATPWRSRRKGFLIAAVASIGIAAMIATTLAAVVMPFLAKDSEPAPRPAALPTTTTPTIVIAPLSVRPVTLALVAQPGRCPPRPPAPAAGPAMPLRTCDVENAADYQLGPEAMVLTLTGATAVTLPGSRSSAVQLTMDAESSARFARYTAGQVGRQVAFVRDGLVLAAPAISVPLDGQSLQLSGNMTAETAQTIARMLREGR